MVAKVARPFASPFSRMLLVIMWLAYACMVVTLVMGKDINVLIITIWWTAGLPWATWGFLSGVRVEPGRSVGGGPIYQRARLEPGEDVVFNAPTRTGLWAQGHLFVTDRRLVVVPIRGPFAGRPCCLSLSRLTRAEVAQDGLGWPWQPLAKERVIVISPDGPLVLRSWIVVPNSRALAAFFGVLCPRDFVDGLVAALELGGVAVRRQDATPE
jgi:hypothetical protein